MRLRSYLDFLVGRRGKWPRLRASTVQLLACEWVVFGLLGLVVLVGLVGCKNPKDDDYYLFPRPDAMPAPDAEPPPAPQAAAPLVEVKGATADLGKKLYLARCASCHGEDGKGKTEAARALPLAPTDLTDVAYLCRTTDGRPFAVPADGDIEGALARGTHKRLEDLVALDAAARRSLTLHVKSLAASFSNPASPLAAVAPESADDAASRARGRTLYLAVGCWRCHGLDGSGGEAAAIANIRWNGQPITRMTPLAERDAFLCGDAADAVYRVVALGFSAGGATIMPRYQEFLEDFARPWKVAPENWTKSIEGKASADELAAVRAWLGEQPERAAVQALKPSEKRARAGAMIWDVVHYVRSL
jgi:mono/diheme cytochrome c family protein